MRARAFAISIITGAFALCAATVAANVLIDPQLVFGTNLVPPPAADYNQRVRRFRDLQQMHGRYDVLLFGSSRARTFDQNAIGARMNGTVASFVVPYGLITDHLPVLEYALRDKAARGERLRGVFLLLDADLIGRRPWTGSDINAFLPPELSGEHPARFWLRYLTAVQFRHWRNGIRRKMHGTLAGLGTGQGQWGERPPAARAGVGGALMTAAAASPAGAPEEAERTFVGQIELDRQLALLRRFAELCREGGVTLIVATSPVRNTVAEGYGVAALERVADRIAEVVEFWDFGHPDWLSDRTDLWQDRIHFSGNVAAMMLDRIFGKPVAVPGEFGRLRGPSARPN
jgi:hypothetical protein